MIRTYERDLRVQIPAAAVTVALTMLLPFIVHSFGGPPVGARWLPLFYAPFLAAMMFHPLVSLTAGVITPFLNHMITGSPVLPVAIILSFELAVFSVVAYQFTHRRPAFWGAAPLAYILAKVASLMLLAIWPGQLVTATPWQFFTTSLMNAWPGLLVLMAINWLAVRGFRRNG
jgi:hypothetical protein